MVTWCTLTRWIVYHFIFSTAPVDDQRNRNQFLILKVIMNHGITKCVKQIGLPAMMRLTGSGTNLVCNWLWITTAWWNRLLWVLHSRPTARRKQGLVGTCTGVQILSHLLHPQRQAPLIKATFWHRWQELFTLFLVDLEHGSAKKIATALMFPCFWNGRM